MEGRENCITQVVKARLQCVVIGAVSQRWNSGNSNNNKKAQNLQTGARVM